MKVINRRGAEAQRTEVKERPILFSGAMVRAILEGRKMEGPKTQSRRVAQIFFSEAYQMGWCEKVWEDKHLGFCGQWNWKNPTTGQNAMTISHRCPYGKPGDRLWVKETHWRWGRWVKNGLTKKGKQAWKFKAADKRVFYVAEVDPPKPKGGRGLAWHKRPSIFMPRALSRITLELTGVRVERVQAITTKDAESEGVQYKVIPAENAPGKVVPLLPLTDRWMTPHLPKRGEITHDSMMRSHFAGLWDSINAEREGGKFSWASNPCVWVLEFKKL